MGWLDSVLATPVIGMLISPDFTVAADYRQIVAPLLNKICAEPERVKFQDLPGWGIEIFSGDGYILRMEVQNLIVDFNYEMTQKARPGQLPTFEVSELRPYTELLKGCTKRIVELVDLIFNRNHQINVHRIGIMVRTALDPNNLPPGVQQLFKHLAIPWPDGLVKCETMLLANLEKKDNYTDRCHHHIRFDQSIQTPQMDFTLDWQRVFSSPITMDSRSKFEELLHQANKATEAYFEKVGEGILNDD